MVFVWLFAGIVLAALSYFLPVRGTDLWPSVNPAGIAALVYCTALVIYIVRKPFPGRVRALAYTLLVVCGLSAFLSWRSWEEASRWQRGRVTDILGLIERSVEEARTYDTLTAVLKEYYSPQNRRTRSLGEIFLTKYPGCREGRPIVVRRFNDPRVERDTTYIYPVKVSDTMIVLAVSHEYARGRDPAFTNVNGRTGMVQIRETLTPKGIRHDTDN